MRRIERLPLEATFVVIVTALVTLSAVHAQQAPNDVRTDAARFAPILDLARRELQETRTPGAAIALIEGDRVVFTGAAGVADVDTGAAMRPEMLFRLGSTTKMFTATALVSLAEEGRVSLDAPIGSFAKGLDPSIARLTAHQLLSHTAGLRDEAPMFGRQDDEALGDGIRSMKTDAFFTEPSAVYSYANPGYWIAGWLVEHVMGKPYADAMRERVFTPLGMARSTFRPTLAMTYPLAQGHESPGSSPPAVIRPAANNVAGWPAGSLFSNVSDLSRFVIAFMNGGRVDGRQALAPGVIARLAGRHAAIPGGADWYGYGLELSERSGVKIVRHGGSRAGYGSTILMAPERHVAVIALGNRSGSGLPQTSRRALEMLLDLPDGALQGETGRPARTTTPVSLDAWIGRYSQGRGDGIEILARNGALLVKRGGQELTAKPDGSLRLTAGSASGPATTLVLVPDENGKPAYVFAGGRAFRRIP